MSWYHRWRNVFRSRRLDEEIEEEFQHHMAETVDRLTADGMSERDAVREARRRLGNYSLQKERTREMDIAAWLDATRVDIFYGLRQLRNSPGFAAVAVLSLALGIGANIAIFQLVNAIRLKPLPVRNPRELVSIDFEEGSARAGAWPARVATMTYGEWEQIRARQQAFTGALAWSPARFNLVTGGEPRYAEGLYVSGDFFRTLGIGAELGRTLNEQDDSQACNPGAVISHAFWQREFGGDPGILGRVVNLEGRSFPVLGVTPPSFFGLEVGRRYDVAIPLCADRLFATDGKGRIPQPAYWWISMIGRLKPGWTAESASAHLRALSPEIMRATLPPGYNADMAKGYLANKLVALEAGSGVSEFRRQYGRPLWLLMAITGLVLLIACANIANLLLARGSAREPEIAVRLAIGASRGRLARQLLAESLLLATSGGALGVGVAFVLSRALVAFIGAPDNPIFINVALDWRVLGFAVALAAATCALFGLAPALRATRMPPISAMRSGGRSVTAGSERFSLRRALVTTQIALALVLLYGALLFTRSLHNLLTVDTGFRPEGILSVDVDFSKSQCPSGRRLTVYRELSERLSALPGVGSVAQVSFTPVSGGTWNNLVAPDGEVAARGKESFFNEVGPGYFGTMGTRLIAGREFNDHDAPPSPKVAIVNEAFAKRLFGGANPVGRAFHMAADAGVPEPIFQVVGLVANTKYRDLREDFRPIAFFPIAQNQRPGAEATFVLRVNGSPGRIMNGAKATVAAMSPSIGIEFRPLTAQLQESLLRERLMAMTSGGFGFLAALLSALGLYGVIAYLVARRRKELGVRIALGAGRKRVIMLVFRETFLTVCAGLTVGIALALWAGKAAAALLYGLQAHDAVSLVAASGLLTVIAFIASYAPARRAAAINPIETLRNE